MSATTLTNETLGLVVFYDDSVYRQLWPEETVYRPGDMIAVLADGSFDGDEFWQFVPVPPNKIGRQISARNHGRTIRLRHTADQPIRSGRAFWFLFVVSMIIWATIVWLIDFIMAR